MFKMLLVLSLVCGVQMAQARSLDPCTPTEKAQPTLLNCVVDSTTYEIQIDTLMSRPLPECQGKRYFEYNTAHVQKFMRGNLIEKFDIENNDFQYTLGLPGTNESQFTSRKPQLRLLQCDTPANGGFSIGN